MLAQGLCFLVSYLPVFLSMEKSMDLNPEILAARREVAASFEQAAPDETESRDLCLHALFGVCRHGTNACKCSKTHPKESLAVNSALLYQVARAVEMKEIREKKASDDAKAKEVLDSLTQDQRDAIKGHFNPPPGRIRPLPKRKGRSSSVGAITK